MCLLLMATQYQTGSWSSPSILVGYGLSATIGPTEPTPADMKRFNSRSGGKHSGKGNWMQNYRPQPIIPSGRPKKMYNYELGDVPVVQTRLPNLTARKIGKYKGLKKTTSNIVRLGVGRDETVYEDPSDSLKKWFEGIGSYGMDTGSTGMSSKGDGGSDAGSDGGKPLVRFNDFEISTNRLGPQSTKRPNTFGLTQDQMIVDSLPSTKRRNSEMSVDEVPDVSTPKRVPTDDGRDYKNKRSRIESISKKRPIADSQTGPSKKSMIDYRE